MTRLQRGILGEDMRELSVGFAALAALVLLLLFSYLANRESARIPGSGYRVFATFNRAGGVAPGTPVQVSGVPVGGVEEITLLPDYRARVMLRVDADVPLPKDTSAAVHTDGLFGGKFVVLQPGGDEALLADGDSILFTQDAVVISDLLDLIISEGRSARSAAPPEAQP
jgi:phospholipid/cholesterol/gamma-HCH transport system substrate-binding protein